MRLPGRCFSARDAGIGASLKPTPCRVGGLGAFEKAGRFIVIPMKTLPKSNRWGPNIKKIKVKIGSLCGDTLQETNISPQNGIVEDDFPFPKVGYVNPLEGTF